jgi:MOSC domain-containing protein YiiM
MTERAIHSVNVGQPRTMEAGGKTVTTSIFKSPVEGRVAVRKHALEGDTQSNLAVHGGPDKAVYGYPLEHFDFWRAQYPDLEIEFGFFGENLVTTGMFEGALHIGDRYRFGSAVLEVSEPRFPCAKMVARIGDPESAEKFIASRKSGYYLRVIEEGAVAVGDTIELVDSSDYPLTIREVVDAHANKDSDPELLRRAIDCPRLPEKWRTRFANRLAGNTG